MGKGFGVNLVAAVTGNAGLGVTARNVALSLQQHGVPLVILDTIHSWGERVPAPGIEAPFARRPDDLCHPVNLYVLSNQAFEKLFQANPWLLARDRFHAAWVWWEASCLPPTWARMWSTLDVAIAGSAFVAQVLGRDLAFTPVVEAAHPLHLPEGVVADRERFGLPAGATVFSASFDPNSDPMRKNPAGTIQAFRAAFPADRDVCLAIRMNNAAGPVGDEVLREMRRFAQDDPRIRFVLEPLSYAQVLSFYCSSDVYVSLHRGEGLGLGLLEAMAFGKPVIATAWSGNTSFMGHDCGCPVRYRMIPVNGAWEFFRPAFAGGAMWADPVLDDAVQWMRRLHADPIHRNTLGRAALKASEVYRARAAGREWIDRLEAAWEARTFLPRAAGKLSSAGM